MSTFTNDEVERLRTLGNAINAGNIRVLKKIVFTRDCFKNCKYEIKR